MKPAHVLISQLQEPSSRRNFRKQLVCKQRQNIGGPMFLEILFCLLLVVLHTKLAAAANNDTAEFIFNGFQGANLTLQGTATIIPSGLLKLTDARKDESAHAFYPSQFRFRDPLNGKVSSFSTTFAFGIISQDLNPSGNGIVMVVSPTTDFSQATAAQYFGLFNISNNGNATNHVFAVELDTIKSPEMEDIDDNHVGIDINGVKSNVSLPAGYYADDTGLLTNLTLVSGQAMQVWIDYDGERMQLNVTLAPIPLARPRRPLLAPSIDLSSVLVSNPMSIGFASTTGPFLTSFYILGWSFNLNGPAQALDYSQLPRLPRAHSKSRWKVLEITLPLASAGLVLIIIGIIGLVVGWKIKYAEELEDWELEYGPHRFSYKDLFRATKGFKDKELLGIGGFGRVYKGVLPSSKLEVAVKKVSHESRQGMREFIAEVVSLGRLRHRNLVQLLGYCRRKGELILVYDYMPNGSLDKFLFDQSKSALDWATRFRVIKGVASGLLYLHEEWEQIIIHRDIKASNVLLDDEFNGRLGDFGLARLYDHGTDPQTTNIVGTMGYLAPELVRTGRVTTATDVYAFGTFVLEVACGRRPVDSAAEPERVVLLDWVVESWRKGSILAARDPRLGEEYVAAEMELALKLGLLCSHPLPTERPSMRQVEQYLEGDATLPELSPAYLSFSALLQNEGFDEHVVSFTSLSMGCASISEEMDVR